MYKLSVGALFKNESHSIREWIEHYLYHGVDHFYLIDDSSTDNSVEIIQPYVDKGIVTLFSGNNWGYYLGRQMNMYNHFIMPRLHESEWLLIVDLDEYVWSPQAIDLKFILNQCRHIGQIQINNTVFGSNGHRHQPKSLVAGFTMRAEMKPTITPECGNLKYFVNTSFNFTSLNIHHATFVDKNDEIHKFVKLDLPYFVLNHYNCQSVNFWNDVKCTRGDGDHYRIRTPDDFKLYDFNEVEDTELYEQNKELLSNLGLI